ncbi:MAG: tetratricopeptide repeat protein [Deltaproteobacteria bacterium]|nr:tetratricopeptide repeat protein [Deltaproteobacteria bacterium]
MAAGKQHVVDVTTATFEAEVLRASQKQLVVVDLWAEWCGPCKTLGPVLEQLAEKHGGAFKLAKIDVDRNPQLAQAFQAQSIPMVVALYGGQIVDSFMGALPKQQVEAWLGELFEALQIEAPEAEAPAPTDPAEAEAYYQAKLAGDASDHGARLALGRLLMAGGRTDEAVALLNGIPAAASEYGAAQASLKLKDVFAEVGALGGEAAARQKLAADPGDRDAAYVVALADGASGRYEPALAVLVDQVTGGTPETRERAKKNAQVFLAAAGRGDEGVEAQRRRLARLLF